MVRKISNPLGLLLCSVLGALAGEPSGLIAHWKLNEGTGTVAYDSGGGAYSGYFSNNPAWTRGRLGPGLVVHGTNYVNVLPNSAFDVITDKDFTISAWVLSTADGRRTAVSQETSFTDMWNMEQISTTRFDFEWLATPIGTTNRQSLRSTGIGLFSTNFWHHVIGMRTGDVVRIYVDGVAGTDSSTITNTVQNLTNTPIWIGGVTSGLDSWIGRVDDVRIYNRALTPAEVSYLYTNATSTDLKVIPTAANSYELSIFLTEPDEFTVEWGDGTTNVYTHAGSSTNYHTYPSVADTSYTLRMYGHAHTFNFFISQIGGEGRWNTIDDILTPIRAIDGLTSAAAMFKYHQIRSIPVGLFDECTNINTFFDVFLGPNKIATIPTNLFANCPKVVGVGSGFYGAFDECTNLQYIPAGLFANNASNQCFGWTFAKCYALTNIPDDLFTNQTRVTDFEYCFLNCRALTRIPPRLFDGLTNVTRYRETFNGCYNLRGVTPTNSSGLRMWQLSGVTSSTNCFTSCSNLNDYAEIPVTAWRNSGNSTIKFIRTGASGANDGSTWTNAYQTLSAVILTRGNTYYLAGGTYQENWNISASGTNWITIKKANTVDNAGDIGWNAAYATTLATILCSNTTYCLGLSSGNIEVNGVTGSGFSGHGILITNSFNDGATEPAPLVTIGGGISPIKLYHLELAGTGFATQAYGGDGINNNNITPQKGLHIAGCYIHGVDKNGMTLGGLVGTSYSDYGLLFETNVINETGGSTGVGWHGQGIQLSYANKDRFTIFRGNIFRNIIGSGMIVFMDGDNSHNDCQIYNNLFYVTDPATYTTISPHVIGNIGNGLCTNILIANNTFYGITNPMLAQIRFYTAPCVNITLTNNLFEGCYYSDTNIVSAQGYNAYYLNTGAGVPSGTSNQVNGSSTTFTSPGTYDFTLKTNGYAVNTGTDLSAIFTTDFAGNTRSGSWDIGAYESVTGSSAPAIIVNRFRTTTLRVGSFKGK